MDWNILSIYLIHKVIALHCTSHLLHIACLGDLFITLNLRRMFRPACIKPYIIRELTLEGAASPIELDENHSQSRPVCLRP